MECCPVYSRDNFNRPGLLYNYFASICLPALLVAVEELRLLEKITNKEVMSEICKVQASNKSSRWLSWFGLQA